MQHKPNTHSKSGGYALLFAILVSSILLSAGLGISNIIYKELVLSAIGKQSTIAFYAADTGAECALYWQQHPNTLGATIFPKNLGTGGADTSRLASCAGKDIRSTASSWVETKTQTGAFYSFQLQLPSNSGCAFVKVIKQGAATVIESRGFNTGCGETTNARRVERALRYRI